MATATRTSRNTKKATAPAPEPEELETEELEDEEFEEMAEDEVAAAPAKGTKAKANAAVFGVKAVCDILSNLAGKPVTTRELRTLIRKMARDESGRVQREIVAGNRSQYSWGGPDDPEVKAIITAFMGGEGEIEKKAALQRLKDKKAAGTIGAKPTTVKPAVKKPATRKAAKPAEPIEEEFDDEELDLDDDE